MPYLLLEFHMPWSRHQKKIWDRWMIFKPKDSRLSCTRHSWEDRYEAATVPCFGWPSSSRAQGLQSTEAGRERREPVLGFDGFGQLKYVEMRQKRWKTHFRMKTLPYDRKHAGDNRLRVLKKVSPTQTFLQQSDLTCSSMQHPSTLSCLVGLSSSPHCEVCSIRKPVGFKGLKLRYWHHDHKSQW